MKRDMFRKLMAASLATVMTVGLAGCGSTETPASAESSAESTEESTEAPAESTEESTEAPAEEEEVGQYTVLKDENGNVYDLGGMEIIIRNWWAPEEPAAPTNEFEEAQLEYREWIQETYNFTIKEQAIGDWGSVPADFVEYCTTGGDDNNYVFTLRDDAAVTGAMAQGLMKDLSKIDCLDFSEDKFQKNLLHKMYSKGDAVYCMYAGISEPRTGVYFNKRLLKEAGIDPETIYDMQAAGTWTWDAWTDLMSKVQRDIDNDGVIDVYGTTQNNGVMVESAIFSNGGELIGNDGSKYVYRLEDPETLEALEWAVSILNDYTLPYPEGAQWDYYKEAYKNAEAAFMPEDGYNMTPGNMLEDVADDFGFVMFPKGPQMDDYVNRWSNNPACIPACYDDEKAWKIAFAWNLYTEPIPGYEDYDPQLAKYYAGARDTRSVEETVTMMTEKGMVTYAGVVPNVNVGPDFIWNIYAGCVVSEAVEAIRDTWKAYIDEANAQ